MRDPTRTELKCSLWSALRCKEFDTACLGEESSHSCPLMTSVSADKNIDLIKVLAGIAASPIRMNTLQDGLDWTLRFLCKAFGADDGEILLLDPKGDELLTSACVGADRDLFLQKFRFGLGDGFPGIAIADRRPMASSRIGVEPLFLRRKALASAGIRTFVSVPIMGPVDRPLGCLDLAWRRRLEI